MGVLQSRTVLVAASSAPPFRASASSLPTSAHQRFARSRGESYRRLSTGLDRSSGPSLRAFRRAPRRGGAGSPHGPGTNRSAYHEGHRPPGAPSPVSYTHLRAHETDSYL